jgi:hypothetical protein
LQLNKIHIFVNKKNKTMITLNEQQLTELNQFCQELPTKYGVPLLQWFKQIQDEQAPKEEKKD